MAGEFEPDLSVLSPQQARLWSELKDVPGSFVLYGGTAVALHLGHRTSVDFDFISGAAFDPDQLYETTAFLRNSKVTQKSANTLTCLVERDGAVRVSFFGAPNLKRIEEPVAAKDHGLKVAGLIDLAGMKAAVVQKRAEAKDYLDLDAIIRSGAVDLPTALSAGRMIYSVTFNPELTLKALSFYEDGNLKTLSREVRDRLSAAVQAVDLDSLPELTRN